MKVLLISATYPTFITFQRKFLGLAYIHAYALEDPKISDQCTLKHQFYEAMHTPPEALAEQIAAERPDVAAFACYVWNTKEILRIALRLRELLPHVKIVLGGPEVSYHYVRILERNPQIDVIVVGEGEQTFRELLLAFLAEKPLGAVRGLAYGHGPGLKVTPPREYLKELDIIPSPYLAGVLEVDDLVGGAYFQTTRGCPFTCTYCDYGRNQPYYEFSLERVKREFEHFREAGARAYFCTDATFNYKRKRANEILRLAIEADLKAMLWIELFPSLIDDSLIELLRQSYRVFCGVGVQTTNPVTMRNIHRIWSPDRITGRLDTIASLKNCYLGLELIMGLPGDDLQTFKECLNWAYARNPHQVFALNLQILPRTPLELQVKEFDIKYMDDDGGHEIISNSTFSELEVAIGKAITNWHRLFQAVFYRLGHILDKKPADLIEKWAYKAYYAGLYDRVWEYHHNNIAPEVFEPLQSCFLEFITAELAERGWEDLAKPLADYFRYIYVRRAKTREGAFIMDILDLNCIATEDRQHRVASALGGELPSPSGTALTRIPRLQSEVLFETYCVDMRKFWSKLEVDAMRAVPREPAVFAIYTEPKTGAGRAVVCDPVARAFIERVDGKASLETLRGSLAADHGHVAGAQVQALYEVLAKAGLVGDAEAPVDPNAHRVGLFSMTDATYF
ncbi:MAG: radical SAM protein [Planctomycetota bacterium]